MSVKVKRNTIKTVSIIIATILIISVIAVIITVIVPNIKNNQIEEKLSQINAEELQTKLIEEIGKTSLNINTDELNTIIGTFEDVKENNYIENADTLFLGVEAHYELTNNWDDFKNYVSVYIIGENNELVIIPCFKIESDNAGNFKSIKCKSSRISHDISSIFIDVLEQDFDIKLEGKYKAEMQESDKDSITIYSLKDEDLINIAREYLNMYGTGSINQQVQLLEEESKNMTIFEITK